MPNTRALFITTAHGGGNGSSLYMVTAHWVLRCSGNSNDDRTPTTFIRRRDCEYEQGGQRYSYPFVEGSPIEGGHLGNPISVVLATGNDLIPPLAAPNEWISQNGVSWATAVAEIDAAAAYARLTGFARASRLVGAQAFAKDPD